jgi:uncharacterized protein YqgV (UPF0045/DUF77 family)
MRATLEVSLYPLNNNYLTIIQAFIDRMQTYEALQLEVNSSSTRISGELSVLISAYEMEISRIWELYGQSVFVTKWLMGDLLNAH